MTDKTALLARVQEQMGMEPKRVWEILSELYDDAYLIGAQEEARRWDALPEDFPPDPLPFPSWWVPFPQSIRDEAS